MSHPTFRIAIGADHGAIDLKNAVVEHLKTPISSPSGPSQWLFQGPPAESKFLAISGYLWRGRWVNHQQATVVSAPNNL